jgi:hypothetical protein
MEADDNKDLQVEVDSNTIFPNQFYPCLRRLEEPNYNSDDHIGDFMQQVNDRNVHDSIRRKRYRINPWGFFIDSSSNLSLKRVEEATDNNTATKQATACKEFQNHMGNCFL